MATVTSLSGALRGKEASAGCLHGRGLPLSDCRRPSPDQNCKGADATRARRVIEEGMGTLSVRVARLRGSYCSAPLPVSMHCTEKDRLLNAYSATAKLYSFAVLNTMRPVSTKDDYDDARRLSEDALDQCNTARAELNWHIALHGC